jgi:homoserine dehydrogenase
MELNIAFVGFGSVARAFARMLQERQSSLANEYGLRWKTTAIATANHGCITSTTGIDLVDAVECVERRTLPRRTSSVDDCC